MFDDGYGGEGLECSGVGGPVEDGVVGGAVEPCGFGACFFVTKRVRRLEDGNGRKAFFFGVNERLVILDSYIMGECKAWVRPSGR